MEPILTSNGGVNEYLVLDSSGMTFRWSTYHAEGVNNATSMFPNAEGIDVHNCLLNFVSKQQKELFTLDLDVQTWAKTSTLLGEFDAEPDQMARILGNFEALYFCEEGGTSSDVHGRDTTGKFFTVVEDVEYTSCGQETTGLAFSPDSKFMYVAYQEESHIHAFWRTHGVLCDASVAEIKYH